MKRCCSIIYHAISDVCRVWIAEAREVLKDEGLLIFTILLPLFYPLLYSWIYNNEVVREVPIAVIDNAQSSLSRTLTSHLDASPDIRIAKRCRNLEEAQRLAGRHDVYGILYIPDDFERRLTRGEQSTVSLYCNMSLMLTYKAIYQSTTAVISEMNAKLQATVAGATTRREALLVSSPLHIEEVAMFNTSGGYGSFILPAVLVLIIHQVLLLSIGMRAGTRREHASRKGISSITTNAKPMTVLYGQTLCYMSLFVVIATYVLLVVPRLFGFIQTIDGGTFTLFVIPYLLACIFFATTISAMFKEREAVMLFVVFTSVPLLFLSGVSWPLSNISPVWQWFSSLFPSTFGIRAFIKFNSMGATLADATTEMTALWIQTAVYFTISCIIFYMRYKNEKSDNSEKGGQSLCASDAAK